MVFWDHIPNLFDLIRLCLGALWVQVQDFFDAVPCKKFQCQYGLHHTEGGREATLRIKPCCRTIASRIGQIQDFSIRDILRAATRSLVGNEIISKEINIRRGQCGQHVFEVGVEQRSAP